MTRLNKTRWRRRRPMKLRGTEKEKKEPNMKIRRKKEKKRS
jgi:hypothetical protein